jgi:hypothetical protein
MVLASNFELEINESEYLKLKLSRDCLSGAFAIEEKYDLLISNFLELEKECMNITCEYMLKNNDDYSDFFDIRARLNRRVVNLLTAARLYMDHLGQHVKSCLFEKDKCKGVKTLFSLQYDDCFEYRFMEALRNYVQHRGLAVHSSSLGASWTSMDKRNGELEYKTCMFTHKDEVSSDKSFKRDVSNEMPEKVNILLASRKYISSISKAHGELRQLISDNVDTSRNIVFKQIESFKKQSDGNSIALAALKVNQDDGEIERVNILLDWDDVRLHLVNKNKVLHSLGQSYVSSSAYNKTLKSDS